VTFRDALRARLISHALMPEEADAILAALASDAIPEGHLAARFLKKDAGGYGDAVMVAMWAATSRQALAWIDAHRPDHVARALFAAEATT